MLKQTLILRVIIILLLVPALAVATYYLYWYGRAWIVEKRVDKAIIDQTELREPPIILTSAFDPSASAGIYKITGWDESINQVSLTYEWPANKRGETINPILSCVLTQVFEQDIKVPKYVTLPTLFVTIHSTPKEQLILSGKCSDSACSEINRECMLKVIREQYVPK
jgi:hypothetical protein